MPNPSIDVSVDDTKKAARTTTALPERPAGVEVGSKRAARRLCGLSRDIARRDDAQRSRHAALAAALKSPRSPDLPAVTAEAVSVTEQNVDVALGALPWPNGVAAGRELFPPLESGKARKSPLANSRIEVRAARTKLEDARRNLSVLRGENDPDFIT